MKPSRVIIVGGGVTGMSAAYHLARRNFGRITLLEKGTLGEGSSSRSAGIITELLWSETGVRARQRSLELFRELSQVLKGYKFQPVGCLNLFDPSSWPEAQQLLPLYRKLDAPFEILSHHEIRRRWPALHPTEELVGIYDPLGGYSEPDEYIPALANENRRLGVELYEKEKVTEFLVRNGSIAGVKTAERTIEGDAVICVVFAWCNKLMENLGLRLPVKTFVHQRFVTGPLPVPVQIPAVNANPLGGYFRPALGQRLLAGVETPEREEYRITSTDFSMVTLSASPDVRRRLLKDLIPLIPALRNASWETEKIGLITFSIDGEPILGPVAKLPGLYVGTAFHSGGFAYNPVAGLLLAEFITEGRTSIDASAFSPDRFEPHAVEEYLSTTIAQKNAFDRRH